MILIPTLRKQVKISSKRCGLALIKALEARQEVWVVELFSVYNHNY